jgi:serine/threonine protein kinase
MKRSAIEAGVSNAKRRQINVLNRSSPQVRIDDEEDVAVDWRNFIEPDEGITTPYWKSIVCVLRDMMCSTRIKEPQRESSVLGSGAFAKVKKVIVEGKTAAVKIIRFKPGDRSKIEREIGLLTAVKGLGIAPDIYGYQINDATNTAHIVMSCLEGFTLEALVDILNDESQAAAIPYSKNPAFVIEVLQKLRNALTVLHSKEILHLDVKLDNIIIGKGPFGTTAVKLIDFGSATRIENYRNPVTSEPTEYSIRLRASRERKSRGGGGAAARAPEVAVINGIAYDKNAAAIADPRLADFFSLEIIRQKIEKALQQPWNMGPAFVLTPGWAPYTGGYRKSRSKKARKPRQKKVTRRYRRPA